MRSDLFIQKIPAPIREIFWWAFWVALAFLVFWNGLLDYPRRDQVPFLEEKAQITGGFWNWFWHAFSYNRTRLLWPGDYFLFRPLHMSLLVLADHFFGQLPKFHGALSLFYTGTATWALFTLLRLVIKNSPLALGISGIFLVFYAGNELVLWRHISPYLLALGFFGIGIYLYLRGIPPSKKTLYFWAGAALCFFLGSCIHEIIALALLIGVFLWAVGSPKKTFQNFRSLLPLGLPALSYVVFNVANFLYFKPATVLGPADKSQGIHILAMAHSAWLVLSASSAAFLFPPLVHLCIGTTGISQWVFVPDSLLLLLAGGLFTGLTTWLVIFVFRKGSTHQQWTVVFALSLILSYSVAIGIGRVYVRGLPYFFDSTYYYGVFAFASCLLIGVPLAHPRIPLWVKGLTWGVLALLIILNLSQLIPGLTEYQFQAERYYER